MKRLSAPYVLVCICLALTCFMNVAYGDITAPTGLNPGDTFHWVFVTSTTRDAESGNIDDYNLFVQAAANASPQVVTGVTGVSSLADITWKAIASAMGTGTSARDNIGDPAAPIYLFEGDLVANDEADLWDGDLSYPIWQTELLNEAPYTSIDNSIYPVVWTGTHQSGQLEYGLGPSFPMCGFFTATDNDWCEAMPVFSYQLLPLYAISGPLTVADVKVIPVPGALLLGSIGIGCVNLLRRRRTL